MISDGAICSRRAAVQVTKNKALQRRASEQPLVGCYAELDSALGSGNLEQLQETRYPQKNSRSLFG
jgi:hypothetical protein